MVKVSNTQGYSTLTGTTGKDVIYGTDSAEQILGLAGNDILSAGAGDDTLEGGAGADKLTGGAGADVFAFTSRLDSYRTNAASYEDIITDFDVTADHLDLSSLGYSGLGSGLDGTLNISYNAATDRTYIKDKLADASGNRFEFSLDGNYLNSLNAAHFIFTPPIVTPPEPVDSAPVLVDPLLDQNATEQAPFTYKLAADTFNDPDGDTLAYTSTQSDGTALPDWLTFDSATRTFTGAPGHQTAGTYNLLVTATDPTGLSVADSFALTVADAPLTTITGTDADETLTGTDWSDLLLGLGGNDVLLGGAGNDILDGGAGRDTLTGGDGNDVFRFSQLSDSYRNYDVDGITATDTLNDFVVGQDKIDVSALGFTGLGDGENHTLDLSLNSDGTKTYIKSAEPDADGNRFEVALNGNYLNTLSASDFTFAEREPQDILFLPTLGQSNARLLRMTVDDNQSGTSDMVADLTKYTDYDVRSQFNDADGNPIDIAIGGSTVNGLSTAPEDEQRLIWWYDDTNQPGPALLRAVGLLKDQLATLSAIDNVTMGIVWGQGEQAAQEISRADDKAAAAANYEASTLKVFDYLHSQLGDFKVYMMETGRYDVDAAKVRGYSDDKIAGVVDGLTYVNAAQEDMAATRSDVDIAVNYSDLPLRQEVDPLYYPDDVWHLNEESDEIVGQRLADYIADDLGYKGDPSDNNSIADIYNDQPPAGSYIQGTDDNDTLVGSDGSDTLDGDLGADTMTGGAGNDLYIVDNAQDVVIETDPTETQIDTVASSVSWTLGDNTEDLKLTGYSAIDGTGNALRNVIDGNSADNVINGEGGDDIMTGGDGSDTYYVDNQDDTVVETNSDRADGGTDSVHSSLTAYTLGDNVENLYVDSPDAANGTGNELDNVIFAGIGNNVLDGRAGNDTVSYEFASGPITATLATTSQQNTGSSGLDNLKNFENLTGSQFDDSLTGNAGANVLTGGAGNDVLNGGAGNDTLVGGAGTDTLNGGTGADTFVFASLADTGTGAARDVITSFKTSEGDKIDLTGIDANSATPEHDAFTFIGSQAFSSFDATGQVRFENGILYASTNANDSAGFEIQVVGAKELHVTDFA